MKRFLVVAGLLALAAPAAFAAPPAGKGKSETSASSSSAQSPAAACKEQRRTMGEANFRSTYGNFGKCVKQQKQTAQDAEKNAAKACKKERADNPTAFADTYGTNANKKNAFGKCVSGKAKEELEEEQEATLNAAKACKKERADNPTAFADTHGTNANKKNAFGKCVSGKAKDETEEEQEETLNAAKACKKERADMGATAFADKYGTNANKKNAFGKCVSGKAKENGDSDD